MIRFEHAALRLALPAPSELTAQGAPSDQPPEEVRLSPLGSAALGPSPWRTEASAPAAMAEDPLFRALGQRATEARREVPSPAMRAALDVQLDAVLAMTSSLGELATLSARVERERGRWLRA